MQLSGLEILWDITDRSVQRIEENIIFFRVRTVLRQHKAKAHPVNQISINSWLNDFLSEPTFGQHRNNWIADLVKY